MGGPVASPLDGPWSVYSPARRWGLLTILFLVSTCNYVDRQVMSVLIEPIKHEFHASDAMMGLLTGIAFAACYAAFGLPAARIADRGDRRRVITIAVVIWSLATAVCGAAQSFIQLALARTAVGFGEAGAIPPAQSLIADYFPPRQRGTALAGFMASSTVGYLVAFTGGAWLAAGFGWRLTMVALGLPGLLLAVATGLGLAEPRRAAGRPLERPDGEAFGIALKVLAGKPTFILLNIAMIFYFVVSYGGLTWLPPYMTRVLHLNLVRAGPVFGLVTAISSLGGMLGGGVVTSRLTARDMRWLGWLPAILLAGACPMFLLGLGSSSPAGFYAGVFAGNIGLSGSLPALFALLHAVCGAKRRATAVAIVFFVANLLGLGLGPVITGSFSDMFTSAQGPVGLRPAIMIAFLALIPAALFAGLGAASLAADTEP